MPGPISIPPWPRAFRPPNVRGWLERRLDEVAPRQVEAAVADAVAQGFALDTTTDYCTRCGATVDASAVTREGCPFCVGRHIAWHRLTRLTPYGEPAAEWIKAMKFGGQWRWAPWFGAQLAEAIGKPLDAQRVIVVPVPLHWWRRFRRGFDQSHLIGEALVEATGYPLVPALRRTRHARAQSLLPPSQRRRNVRRCFEARPVDLTGCEVILVDDVKTTGATLSVCARALRKRGAKTIHVAVAAVADPRGQGFETV